MGGEGGKEGGREGVGTKLNRRRKKLNPEWKRNQTSTCFL